MRILALVTDAFGGHGGIALYNRDFLTALCANSVCDEVVAIPRLMPHVSEPLPRKLTYVTSGLNSKVGYIKAVFKSVKKNSQFDLIVCGHINLVPLALILRGWLRVPILLEIYGIDAWQPTSSFLTNLLVRKVDSFISISEITNNRFISWSKISQFKSNILPNAIHIEKYGPSPKSHKLLMRYNLTDKVVIMTFGRLVAQSRQKGFDEVLELLPELRAEIPNIVYMIAGMGNDQSRLEAKAHSLGISESVVFTGFVKDEEKADHFRLADVYVMPSRGEGFGFVFLEALACGIPCVGSTEDGSREALLNGKLGKLVHPADSNGIRAAIRESLALEGRIVPGGLEYFSFKNFSDRLWCIINELVGKQPK